MSEDTRYHLLAPAETSPKFLGHIFWFVHPWVAAHSPCLAWSVAIAQPKFLVHAILGNNEHKKLTAQSPNIPFVIQGEDSLFLACLTHLRSKQFGKKSGVYSYSIRAKELITDWSVWMTQKYGWCVFMYSPVSSSPSLHLQGERKLHFFTSHNPRAEGISPVLAKMKNEIGNLIISFHCPSFPSVLTFQRVDDLNQNSLWQAVTSHDLFFPSNHQTMSFWTEENIYTGQRKICNWHFRTI